MFIFNLNILLSICPESGIRIANISYGQLLVLKIKTYKNHASQVK